MSKTSDTTGSLDQTNAAAAAPAGASAPSPAAGVSPALMQKKLAARRKASQGKLARGSDPALEAPADPDEAGDGAGAAPAASNAPGGGDPVKAAFAGAPSPLPHMDKIKRAFASHDISRVQAYHDPAANQAVQAMGSRAFALGDKIAFAEASPSEELVAHEVAHTVQQQQGGAAGVQHKSAGGGGDAFEQEADRAAATAVGGGQVKIGLSTGPTVQHNKFTDGASLAGEGAALYANIVVVGGFEAAFLGVADFNVPVGKIMGHLKAFTALPFNLNPGDIVHVQVITRGTKSITITSPHLGAPSMAMTGMTTGAVSLSGTEIFVSGENPVASIRIANLQCATPKFTTASGTVSATYVDMDQLVMIGGVDALGINSGVHFGAFNVRGLIYPGVPPVDMALKDINASFAGIPGLLVPPGGSTRAPTAAAAPKPGAAGPAGAPAVSTGAVPAGASVFIGLDQFRVGATATAAKGNAEHGGLGHGIVQLRQGATELAGVEIWGFHAGADGTRMGGSIDALELRGQPNYVGGLLDAPELQGQPEVKKAVDLVKSLGIAPTVGGKIRLTKLGYDNKAGAQTADGSLHTELKDASFGTLTVDLDGFHGDVKSGVGGVNFNAFKASLVGPDGNVGLILTAPPTAGDAVAANADGSKTMKPMTFSFTGNTDHADKLLAALDKSVKAMPPQAKAAVAAVQSLGASAGGTIGATVAKDGTVKVSGDVHAAIDIAKLGKLSVSIAGFTGAGTETKGQATGSAAFTKFEATLTDASGGEAGYLSIDNSQETIGAKSVDAKGSFVVRGKPSTLVTALEQHVHALPPQTMAVLKLVHAYGLGGSASGTMSVHEEGNSLVTKGSMQAHVAAEGGVVDVAVENLDGDVTGHPLGINFDKFTATLKSTTNSDAAGIEITNQKGSDIGTGAKRQTSVKAQQIHVHGQAANLRILANALTNQVHSLPPAMQGVVSFAKTHALAAGGDVTLSNVALGEKQGTLAASSDVDASFKVGTLGTATVKVAKLHADITGSDVSNARFDSLKASLVDAHGKSIANLSMRGLQNASATAAKGSEDVAFKLSDVTVTGSSSAIDGLLDGINKQVSTLPPTVRAAFTAVRSMGIDLTGTVALDQANVTKQGNTTTASGTLSTHLAVPQVGFIDVVLKGFNTTVTDGAPPQGTSFKELTAEMYAAKGSKSAAKLTIEGLDEAPQQAGANPADYHFKAGKIAATGDGPQVTKMMQALKDHVKNLPVPLQNAFEIVQSYAPVMSADASMAITDATFGKTNGKLTADGDFSATLDVPTAGLATIDAKGFHMNADGTAGLASLNIYVNDRAAGAGKPAAQFTVSNVSGPIDLSKPVTVGNVSVDGDPSRIATVLQAATGRQLPAQLHDSLMMVKSLNLDTSGLRVSKDPGPSGDYLVQANEITLSGDVNITDKSGTIYHATGAQLVVHAPKTKLGPKFEPREITSGEIDVTGTFSSGPNVMVGSLKLASAHIQCDDDGRPVDVTCAGIRADVRATKGSIASFGNAANSAVAPAAPSSGAQPAQQPSAGYAPAPQAPTDGSANGGGLAPPNVGAMVPLVKDVDINMTTPLHPGEWGAIQVLAGTNLHLQLQVRNHAIVAANTKAVFQPLLKLPLWFKTGGAYLKQDGSGFDVKIDVRGFFDINATWIARLVGAMGKQPLQLDLRALYNQLLPAPAQAAQTAEASHASSGSGGRNRTAAPSADRDAQKLAQEHMQWSRESEDVFFSIDGKRASLDRSQQQWAAPYLARIKAAQTDQDKAAITAEARNSPEGRKLQAKYDKVQSDWDRDMDKEKGKEPMSHHAKDLFSLQGFEVTQSHGTADINVVNENNRPAALSNDITVPAGMQTHLHGAVDGNGDMNLSADNLAATVRGQRVDMQGVTGGAQGSATQSNGGVGGQVDVATFGIEKLHWNQAPATKPPGR
jgi:hypothetical protein